MHTALRGRSLWILFGCALAACSGSADRPDASTPDAGADAAARDGGAGADARIPPAPEGVLRTSRVWARSYAYGGVESGNAGAQLFEQDPAPIGTTREDLGGGCAATTVTLLVEPGMGAFPEYRDAGDIHITGGLSPIAIVKGGSPYYQSITSDTRLWDAGATLTITAEGGADVDPFSASVPAPTNVVVTSPALPLGGAPPVDVDRAADLTVTWEAGALGEAVRVQVVGPELDGEPYTTVECRFDPSAGTGTIPSAVLGHIDRTGRGFLAVETLSERTVAAGDWGPVQIEMTAGGVWETGNNYLATIEVR